MKNRSLLLFFFLACFVRGFSQHSCCTSDGAGAFAALAKDPAFRNSHPEPIVYALGDPAGADITFETPDGRPGRGYLIKKAGSNRFVFVFHEWWGLNDHIRREADKIYQELGDANVLAIDLYDGRVAATRDSAAKYSGQMTAERGEAIINGAITYAGSKASVATIGWCFGGGWSMRAALMAGEKCRACVMFYGTPETDPKKLEPLRAPILFIWAARDKWINAEMVGKFETAMKTAGKKVESHRYEADHGFANPSNPNFNNAYAADAFRKTFEFLRLNFK
jgi:carboxymethylenebutenolidase